MVVIATHIDVGDPSQQGGEGAVLGSDILPCLNHTEEEKASSVVTGTLQNKSAFNTLTPHSLEQLFSSDVFQCVTGSPGQQSVEKIYQHGV